jgi:alpha-beta hydrolase superfamily lysophospholipase
MGRCLGALGCRWTYSVPAVTRLFLKDELLDAQLVRAVGAAGYGGADLGECLLAAGRIDERDLGSWFEQWTATATAVGGLAEGEAVAGRCVSARLAFLRACTYHRTAGVMLLGQPLDQRLVSAYRAQADMFAAAMDLMELPVERIEIPFGNMALPGYFFCAAADGRPRATVILTGGYDGTVEELYFANGAAALARGYNVLAFDGPGQGRVLTEQRRVIRADWENVVTPVVDYALGRADVDGERIALIGLSFGAHLAPRAASGEHRLAACVADCGAYDLYDAFLARLPGPLANPKVLGRERVRLCLARILDRVAAKPTAGWALRRGMLVHGVDDPLAYVDALREFTLKDRASRIRCPTWVCSAESDDISASAPQLIDALTCEKTYVRFTAAEGADDHCEQAARRLYHARAFAWLDDRLAPRRV